MTEKKASAKSKSEPKPKGETARTPEPLYRERPYTGCGDPRPWSKRRRDR
jgi:hypothetical protein